MTLERGTKVGVKYQGNKEEGQVEGDDSGNELLAGWIFWFCV